MTEKITERSGAGLPLSHTYGYQVLMQKSEYDFDSTVPAQATFTPFESKEIFAYTDNQAYLTFYHVGVRVYLTVTKTTNLQHRSIPLHIYWTKNGGIGYVSDRDLILPWIQLLSNTSAVMTNPPIFLVCDNFEGMFVLIPCTMNGAYSCGNFAVRRGVPKQFAVLAKLMNIAPSSKDENNAYIRCMLRALSIRSDDTQDLIPSDGNTRTDAPYYTDEDTSSIIRGALLGLEPDGKVVRWCNILVGYDLERTGLHHYFDALPLVGEMWKTQETPKIAVESFVEEYTALRRDLPLLDKGNALYMQWARSALPTDHNGALVRAGKYAIYYGEVTGDETDIPDWLRALIKTT
jgi:hypothetical protein